ncbi:MAG: hypothetical protein ABSA33_05270, partial [Candidatus Micrarchaeaceae archaeon]
MIEPHGYVLVYIPNHPRAQKSGSYEGYVFEHIVVAMNKLKRELFPREEVHHLDQNKHHNRWANLLVLHGSQHAKLHRWLDSIDYEPVIKRYRYSSDPAYVAKV